MKPGTYQNCKIVACGLGIFEEKKTPYYWIEFENQESESIEAKFFLTDTIQKDGKTVKERSIDKLIELGFKGKKLTDLNNPQIAVSDMFIMPEEGISLVVEEEAYVDKDNVSRIKSVVKYVNIRKVDKSKLDHPTSLRVFGSMGFDGLLMERRKVVTEPKPAPAQAAQAKFADGDIPF